MALIEKKIVDLIQILETNHIQIRTATIIEKDDIEIAKTYHREVFSPIDDISNQDEKIKTIANAIWTEEVINSYKQSLLKIK